MMRRCLAAAAAVVSLAAFAPDVAANRAPSSTRAHRAPARSAHHGHASRPRVSASYVRTRTRWHRPPGSVERERWLRAEPPPLVLRPVHGGHSYSLAPSADGTFDEAQLAIAREAFTYHEDAQSHDIHPRLLELCYRAVRRFRAPYVHLVSGYRTTRATSRHNQGRAMDIVLPGVSDAQLSAFLRKQGFVGVGVYPISGFVHLDVRARSFYWVDRSGPDDESSIHPVRAAEVAANDRSARRRGETSVPDLVIAATATGTEPASAQNGTGAASEE